MPDQVLGRRSVDWDQIARWNDGIREEFFSGQWAGRPVYLDLEDDVVERIARRAGVASDDPEQSLAALLRPTLNVASGSPPLLDQHVRRARSWRIQGAQGTPPFLAILALLSLVAEGMRSDGEFRASNYYGRFCQAMDLDHEKSSVRTKVANGFKDASSALWGGLNGWLDSAEGRLGLPTAYAFDSRVYVGPPLSQALVRDADRRLLPELFSAYRLRPGQVVSRSDMARLMGDWIGGSRMSLGLKRLLGKGAEIANRIADVACIELQAWNGEVEEGGEAQTDEASLLLTGQLRRQPRRRLYLDVGIERGLHLPSGAYRLSDGASTHARAALEGLEGAIEPLEADAQGWRRVADSGEIAFGDLLLADLTVSNEDASLRHAARRLIVLEHDEEVRRYTEVPRAQLGTSNLLLCHETFVDELIGVLEEVARPGPSPQGPSDLPGVPEGWVCFAPVEILTISDTDNVDLMPLVPISWTQVSLGGGFSLPGRLTWLTEAPPEIRASTAEGDQLLLRLSCERSLDGDQPDDLDLATLPGAGVAAIHPSPDGDYRISLTDAEHPKAAVLASALIRLRSAETPRPVLSEDEPGLTHSFDDVLGSISASPEGARSEVDGALLRGVDLTPQVFDPSSPDDLPPSTLLSRGDLKAFEENDLGVPVSEVRGGGVPECLLGSGHYFVLTAYSPDVPQSSRIEGTCRECGLEKDWPSRPRRKRKLAKSVDAEAMAGDLGVGAAIGDLRPISEEQSADWDRLMEALGFAQRGPWTSFDAMASRMNDAPWFALEAARQLSGLGHLNIAVHPGSLRPVRWSLAPATIAMTGPQRAVLAGYRSRTMLEALAEDVEILEGRFTKEAQTEGPALVAIEGLDVAAIEELIASCADTLGYELQLSVQPGQAIAQHLPPLLKLREKLRRLERLPDRPLEVFDFPTAKWNRIDEVERPGAYRIVERPFLYCAATDTHGQLVAADNRLAKWLGAQGLGAGLLSYDADSETLACPLGAQLPGLYERAAVLASGRCPVPRSNGTVAYAEVPASLAAHIWAAVAPSKLMNQP